MKIAYQLLQKKTFLKDISYNLTHPYTGKVILQSKNNKEYNNFLNQILENYFPKEKSKLYDNHS